jgi:GMP synthase-like glutamine amidotransferase
MKCILSLNFKTEGIRMKIHCIQHVEFETLGTIVEWIEEKKHSLSITRLYKNEIFSGIDDFDLLIIMGGPMNIYEYEKCPWLKEEKKVYRRNYLCRKSSTWNLSWCSACC